MFSVSCISKFVCFKSLIVFSNCKKSRLNSHRVVEIIHDNKYKYPHKVAIAISLLHKHKFRYSLSTPRQKLSQRKIFLCWYENRPVSPPGTLCAVTPGSWLGKKKKEDKWVTSLASPFRKQEKETRFQISVNILFYKTNNVSFKVLSHTLCKYNYLRCQREKKRFGKLRKQRQTNLENI